MNLFKKMLSIIVIVQLVVLISLMTVTSWKKFNTLYGDFQTIASKSQHYNRDISLSKIVQNEKAIQGLLSSMVTDKLQRFKSSVEQPFIDKVYQQNRYLPICQADNPNDLGIKKEIESRAKKFLGKRYVWGATGPNTFDCSGFTMKVYRSAGINLPRVSRNQAKVGALVRYENLQRGDMVFFDTHKRRTGQVTHVGIYLEKGKFIHASSGNKKVVITSFNKKKFYKNRFLWGRRILKENVHYAFNSISFPSVNKLLPTSIL